MFHTGKKNETSEEEEHKAEAITKKENPEKMTVVAKETYFHEELATNATLSHVVGTRLEPPQTT